MNADQFFAIDFEKLSESFGNLFKDVTNILTAIRHDSNKLSSGSQRCTKRIRCTKINRPMSPALDISALQSDKKAYHALEIRSVTI
jgi:hypothetical protein